MPSIHTSTPKRVPNPEHRRNGAQGVQFWVLLIASVVLSLTACGGAVTAVALHGQRTSRTYPLAGQRSTDPPSPDPNAPSALGPGAAMADVADPNGASTRVPACAYPATDTGMPEGRAAEPPEARPTHLGLVIARVSTNLGEITMQLRGDAAACTVNAFVSLASSSFYRDTACHRLTTDGRWLLQCGDPSGTGAGGPGFRFPDENLPTQTHPTYPRGTVAMANAAPNANGSQFFITYRDSDLDPYYPIFGRVVAGIEIIDLVAASGTDSGALDGHPRQELHINKITIDPS